MVEAGIKFKIKTYRLLIDQLGSLLVSFDTRIPLSIVTQYAQSVLTLSECPDHIEHLTESEWSSIISTCVKCVSQYVASHIDGRTESRIPHITKTFMDAARSFICHKTNSDPTPLFRYMIPQLVFFLDAFSEENPTHSPVLHMATLGLKHIRYDDFLMAQTIAWSGLNAISRVSFSRYVQPESLFEFLALACEPLQHVLPSEDSDDNALGVCLLVDMKLLHDSIDYAFRMLCNTSFTRGVSMNNIDFWSTQDERNLVHLLPQPFNVCSPRCAVDSLVGLTNLYLCHKSNFRPRSKKQRLQSPNGVSRKSSSATAPCLGPFYGESDAPLLKLVAGELDIVLTEIALESFIFWLYENPSKIGKENAIKALLYYIEDANISPNLKSWVLILEVCVIRRFEVETIILSKIWTYAVDNLRIPNVDKAACFCIDVILSVYPMTSESISMVTKAMSPNVPQLSDASLRLVWRLSNIIEGQDIYEWLKNSLIHCARSSNADCLEQMSLFRLVQTVTALCHTTLLDGIQRPEWIDNKPMDTAGDIAEYLPTTCETKEKKFVVCTYAPLAARFPLNASRMADWLKTLFEISTEHQESTFSPWKIFSAIFTALFVSGFGLSSQTSLTSLQNCVHSLQSELTPLLSRIISQSALKTILRTLVDYAAILDTAIDLLPGLADVSSIILTSLASFLMKHMEGHKIIPLRQLSCAYISLSFGSRQLTSLEELVSREIYADVILESYPVWQKKVRLADDSQYRRILRALGSKIWQPYATQGSEKAILLCCDLLCLHTDTTDASQEWNDLSAWLMRLFMTEMTSSIRIVRGILALFALTSSPAVSDVITSRSFRALLLISNSVVDIATITQRSGKVLGIVSDSLDKFDKTIPSIASKVRVDLLNALILSSHSQRLEPLMELLYLSQTVEFDVLRSAWTSVAQSLSFDSRGLFREFHFAILWHWQVIRAQPLAEFPYRVIGYKTELEFISDAIDSITVIAMAINSDNEAVIRIYRTVASRFSSDSDDAYGWMLKAAYPLSFALTPFSERIAKSYKKILNQDFPVERFCGDIVAGLFIGVYPDSYSDMPFPHIHEKEFNEKMRDLKSQHDAAFLTDKHLWIYVAVQIAAKKELMDDFSVAELLSFRCRLLLSFARDHLTEEAVGILLRRLLVYGPNTWNLTQILLLKCRSEHTKLFIQMTIDSLKYEYTVDQYQWILDNSPEDMPGYVSVALRYMCFDKANVQFVAHDVEQRYYFSAHDIDLFMLENSTLRNPFLDILASQADNKDYESWLLSKQLSEQTYRKLRQIDSSDWPPARAAFLAKLTVKSLDPTKSNSFIIHTRDVSASNQSVADLICHSVLSDHWLLALKCLFSLPEKPVFTDYNGPHKFEYITIAQLQNCTFVSPSEQAKQCLQLSSATVTLSRNKMCENSDIHKFSLSETLSRYLIVNPAFFGYQDLALSSVEFAYVLYSILLCDSMKAKGLLSELWQDFLINDAHILKSVTIPTLLRLKGVKFLNPKQWFDFAENAQQFGNSLSALVFCELAAGRWSTEAPNRTQSQYLNSSEVSKLYTDICTSIGEKDLIFGARQAPSLAAALHKDELVYKSGLFNNAALDIGALSDSMQRSGLYGMALRHVTTTESQAELSWKLGEWDVQIGSLDRNNQQELLFQFFTQCRQPDVSIIDTASQYLGLSWTSVAPRSDILRTCAVIYSAVNTFAKDEIMSLSTPFSNDIEHLEEICRGQEIMCQVIIHDLKSSRLQLDSVTDTNISSSKTLSESYTAMSNESAPRPDHRKFDLRCLQLASYMAKAVRISRAAGDFQRSISAAIRLKNIDTSSASEKYSSLIAIISNVEQAQTAWSFGDKSVAIELLKETESLFRRYDAAVELYSTSELYALLGTWCSIARHEEDSQIRQYFEKSIQRKSTSPAVSRSRVSYLFASFCNRKYNSSELSEAIEVARRLRDRKVEEIMALEALIQAKGSADSSTRNAMAMQLKKTKRMHMSDCKDFEQLSSSRDWYLDHAVKYYLESICDGGKVARGRDHTTGSLNYGSVSVSCFCNLWLAHCMRMDLNFVVQAAIPSIPTALLVPWINQLTSRLGPNRNSDLFQQNLWDLLARLCENHPYHCLYQILALTYIPKTNDSKKKAEKSNKSEAGEALLTYLKGRKKVSPYLLENFKQFAEQVMEIVAVPAETKVLHLDSIPNRVWWQRTLPSLKIPVITEQIPVRFDCNYDGVPYIVGVGRDIPIASGLSRPKIVSFRNSEGRTRRSIFKGNDDLRQDSIMQQVFSEVNNLFDRHQETRIRELRVRKYIVIPLGPKAGAIEFVKGAVALNDILVDLHRRHRPQDWDVKKAREKMKTVEAGTAREKVEVFSSICSKMQPVLRHFFFEKFDEPSMWYAHRTQYAKSTAAISIVGYVLGLGDRHCNNILLDSRSGEPIHIDLGIAFDSGKTLRIPELVPFRLTRDIVDGLGISGVNGIFRQSCEYTLKMLRDESEHIEAILNVFRYDPLYSWTISPVKRARLQHLASQAQPPQPQPRSTRHQSSSLVLQEQSKSEDGDANGSITSEADRALTVVKQKLSGTLSVEAQVRELVQQAMDPKLLGTMFLGWNPFY